MKRLNQEDVLGLTLPATFTLSRDIPMFYRDDNRACCGRGHTGCSAIQGNIGDEFTVEKLSESNYCVEVIFKEQKIRMIAFRVAWLVNEYCSQKD